MPALFGDWYRAINRDVGGVGAFVSVEARVLGRPRIREWQGGVGPGEAQTSSKGEEKDRHYS